MFAFPLCYKYAIICITHIFSRLYKKPVGINVKKSYISGMSSKKLDNFNKINIPLRIYNL